MPANEWYHLGEFSPERIMVKRVLFVTWDGPQVEYLRTLFLPIFSRLSKDGFVFHVVQFTWGGQGGQAENKVACERVGVSYHSVRVFRRPVSIGSLVSLAFGARAIRKHARALGIDILMPRSTFPSIAARLANRKLGLPLVLDADGLPLDERVDFAGRSPSSLMYRILRDAEAEAVRSASVVLTRSHKASEILLARAGAGCEPSKFYVVLNGRDAHFFAPLNDVARLKARRSLGIPLDPPVLIYVGSMGSQYCMAAMLVFFNKVREYIPNTHFIVLTGDPRSARSELRRLAADVSNIRILRVQPEEVPKYLASADLGIALRKRAFSTQAVAPVKLGEYLLCGLPILASAGVGELTSINSLSGFIVDDVDDMAMAGAARWFCTTVMNDREASRATARAAGEKNFAIDSSTESYRLALARVLEH